MSQLTNIRSQVRRKIASARFPLNKRARVEDIIVLAIAHYKLYKNRAASTQTPVETDGACHSVCERGPKDKKLMRMYLLSQLHYAWLIGFDDYPTINNKTYPDTPFVVFAQSILVSEGIFRFIGNLEEFRSYRRGQFLNSGLEIVRGKPK